MLTRENQMLRMRIRELGMPDSVSRVKTMLMFLERQLNEGDTATTNSPSTSSNLAGPSVDAENVQAAPEGRTGDGEDKD